MDHPAGYSGPSIIPHLWYPEPDAAIEFLERAFDFQTHSRIADSEGNTRAELRIGDGFILVGSANTPHFMFRTPREAGGVNTGAVYIAVGDVNAIYERAKDAGAAMVRELADTDYGSRDFSAHDPDGYLWNFGTYRPQINDGSGATAEAVVYDALRYERPRTAMRWLADAFGFEEHSVIAGNGDEDVPHALMRFGNSLLMISGTRQNDPLKMLPPHLASQPHLGGVHTQEIHVVTTDPDAHCERARKADAAILEPPSDTWCGARGYVARDPEGYVWNFSTYRPGQKSRSNNATKDVAVGRSA
jgi:uncharacterized glyoxalase superfamily protein PhnB